MTSHDPVKNTHTSRWESGDNVTPLTDPSAHVLRLLDLALIYEREGARTSQDLTDTWISSTAVVHLHHCHLTDCHLICLLYLTHLLNLREHLWLRREASGSYRSPEPENEKKHSVINYQLKCIPLYKIFREIIKDIVHHLHRSRTTNTLLKVP